MTSRRDRKLPGSVPDPESSEERVSGDEFEDYCDDQLKINMDDIELEEQNQHIVYPINYHHYMDMDDISEEETDDVGSTPRKVLHSPGAPEQSRIKKGSGHSFIKMGNDIKDNLYNLSKFGLHQTEKMAFYTVKAKRKSTLHGSSNFRWWSRKNIYYHLLDINGFTLFLWMVAGYSISSMLFSLLNWPFVDEIWCESGEIWWGSDASAITLHDGSFGVACVYAWSNVVTMGYGPCLAASYGTFALGTFQQFVGVLLNVIVLSVVVTMFQQPHPKIIFSKHALITLRDGEPFLMFRIGNLRCNLIYYPDIRLSLVRFHKTKEGESFAQYFTLDITYPNNLSAVSTITHRINEKSPLFGVGKDDLAPLALSVVFLGHDGVYHDQLSCTGRYSGKDIIMEPVLFADMQRKDPKTGNYIADFSLFDELKPCVGDGVGQELECAVTNMCRMKNQEGNRLKANVHRTSVSWSPTGTHKQSMFNFVNTDLTVRKAAKKFKQNSPTAKAIRLNPMTSIAKKTKLSSVSSLTASTVSTKSNSPASLNNSSHAVSTIKDSESLQLISVPMMDSDIVYLCTGCTKRGNELIQTCTYSRIVQMFLIQAGIPHRVLAIDLEDKPDWFVHSSETKQCPTVCYRNDWVCSTREILLSLFSWFPNETMVLNSSQELPWEPYELFSEVEIALYHYLVSKPENIGSPKKSKHHQKSPFISMHKQLICCDSYLLHPLSELREEQFQTKMRNQQLDEENPYVCIGVIYRQNRTLRVCKDSRPIEIFFLETKIRYHAVLIDLEKVPNWFENATSGACPCVYFLGSWFSTFEEIMKLCQANQYIKYSKFMHAKSTLPFHGYELGEEFSRLAIEVMKTPRTDSHFIPNLKKMIDFLMLVELELARLEATNSGPYLSGSSLGIDDIFLTCYMWYYIYTIFKPYRKFSLETSETEHSVAFPHLKTYLNGLILSPSFCMTITVDAVTYIMSLNARSEDNVFLLSDDARDEISPDWIEAECDKSIEVLKAEAVNVCVSYDDSSFSVLGIFPPAFDFNQLYLCVGAHRRAGSLVKLCPYSRLMEIFVKEANIPCEVIRIELTKKPQWFLERTKGTCPAVYFRGRWYCDTDSIIGLLFTEKSPYYKEYKALTQPPTGLQWDGVALVNEYRKHMFAYLAAPPWDTTCLDKKIAMVKFLQIIEDKLRNNKLSGDGLFLHGHQLGFDDVWLGATMWYYTRGMLQPFQKFVLENEGFTYIGEWIDMLQQRKYFAESICEYPLPLIGYFFAKRFGNEKMGFPHYAMTPECERLEEETCNLLRAKAFVVESPEPVITGGEGSEGTTKSNLSRILNSVNKILSNHNSGNNQCYLVGNSLTLVDVLLAPLLHTFIFLLPYYKNYSFEKQGYTEIITYLNHIVHQAHFRPCFPDDLGPAIILRTAKTLGMQFDHLKMTDQIAEDEDEATKRVEQRRRNEEITKRLKVKQVMRQFKPKARASLAKHLSMYAREGNKAKMDSDKDSASRPQMGPRGARSMVNITKEKSRRETLKHAKSNAERPRRKSEKPKSAPQEKAEQDILFCL